MFYFGGDPILKKDIGIWCFPNMFHLLPNMLLSKDPMVIHHFPNRKSKFQSSNLCKLDEPEPLTSFQNTFGYGEVSLGGEEPNEKKSPIHTHTHTHTHHSSMVACLWVLVHSGPTIEVHPTEYPCALKMGAGGAFKEAY